MYKGQSIAMELVISSKLKINLYLLKIKLLLM